MLVGKNILRHHNQDCRQPFDHHGCFCGCLWSSCEYCNSHGSCHPETIPNDETLNEANDETLNEANDETLNEANDETLNEANAKTDRKSG